MDDAGILTAELGDAGDVLVLEPGAAPSTLQLTINGDVHSYDQDSVRGLRVWAAGGDDRIEVSPIVGVAASLSGGDGNDTLIGGYGADELDGGAGADSLVGDDGDDLFHAEPGDTISGGPGINSVELTVSGSDAADVIRLENIDDLTTRLTLNGQFYDFVRYELTSVSIDAGAGDDLVELVGDVAVPVTVFGGAGADTLRGGVGDDVLDGGDDADSISGGDGNDTLLAEPADSVAGDAGDDSILLSVVGSDAADVIQLLYPALDEFTTRLVINDVTYDYPRSDLVSAQVDAGAGSDRVEFAGDVTVRGVITGGDGDDTLLAGAADDVVDGGLGNDSIGGGAGADVLSGVEGLDTIDAGAGDDLIDGGADDDSLAGAAGLDTIWGDTGADTISGGDDDDLLGGGLAEGYATDWFDGNDLITGDEGDDTLFGAAGDDTLSGGADDDVLDGGLSADSVSGGDGNDTLFAEPADTVAGDAGDDSILLSVVGSDAADVIQLLYPALDKFTTRLVINDVTYDYVRSDLVSARVDAGAGGDRVEFGVDVVVRGAE